MFMYEIFIFDVDGTLIDTEEAVMGSLQKMLKVHFNLSVPQQDLKFVLGIPGAVSLPRLGITDIELGNQLWNNYMADFKKTIHVFDGIQQLLSTLKEHSVTTGVVTSKTYQEYQNDFVPFGLADDLNYIVCADDTELHKPHPDPLQKFLQISEAIAESSIYIGDTIYDYECARDAGIDFGLALWGCKNPDSIPAKYKFEHPKDILSLIKPQ
jgi:HAD superfamily hydrolase (TIGR01549 family)